HDWPSQIHVPDYHSTVLATRGAREAVRGERDRMQGSWPLRPAKRLLHHAGACIEVTRLTVHEHRAEYVTRRMKREIVHGAERRFCLPRFTFLQRSREEYPSGPAHHPLRRWVETDASGNAVAV